MMIPAREGSRFGSPARGIGRWRAKEHTRGSETGCLKSTRKTGTGQTLPPLFAIIRKGYPIKRPDSVNLAAPLNRDGGLLGCSRSYQASIKIGRALYAGIVYLKNEIPRP